MTNETWVPEWTFGDRIRKVRREKGLSQTQLAAALKIKSANVAAWETGEVVQPRNIFAIARQIERLYGVPAEWVLGLEVYRPTPGTKTGMMDVTTVTYSNNMAPSGYARSTIGQLEAAA